LRTDTFTSISATNPVSFAKLDPSLGTLNCAKLSYNVTSVLSFSIANKDTNIQIYDFDFTQYTGISGPGFFKSANVVANYGPYTLDTVGHTPADSVAVGPDTLFNNKFISANITSSLASYIGTGNININYDNSYSTHFLSGSVNANFQVRGFTIVNFRMVYYYCPAAILANSINGFSAVKSGNQVTLKWTGQNEQNTDIYEIEYSKDGIHFSSAARQAAYVDDAGAASKYEYQYNLAATAADRLYFRIKKTNAAGKSGYSAIRVINLGAGSTAISNFQLYPNPASKHLNVEWSSPVTGNISVGVLNTVGQQVYSQAFELNGSNNVQLNLPASVKPGVYYLLVKDVGNHTQQLTKLLIH
jgi:Secretion system C-terminal sorting domain